MTAAPLLVVVAAAVVWWPGCRGDERKPAHEWSYACSADYTQADGRRDHKDYGSWLLMPGDEIQPVVIGRPPLRDFTYTCRRTTPWP